MRRESRGWSPGEVGGGRGWEGGAADPRTGQQLLEARLAAGACDYPSREERKAGKGEKGQLAEGVGPGEAEGKARRRRA